MRQLRIPITQSAFFFTLAFGGFFQFFACSPAAPKTPVGEKFPPFDNLLIAADSLPAEAVFAEAQHFPGSWPDSFFQYRVHELHGRQDVAGNELAMNFYEKMRPNRADVAAIGDYYRGVRCQYGGKFDSAEVCYARASEWFETSSDPWYPIAILTSRIGNANILNRSDQAVSLGYRLLETLQKRGDSLETNRAQSSLANVFKAKGDFDKALELLAGPLLFFENRRDTANWEYALAVQGNAFFAKKDFPKALELGQKQLAFCRKMGHPQRIVESLSNISRTLGKLGNWPATLDTLRMVEKMNLASANKFMHPNIQLRFGEALFMLNHLPEADVYLKKALDTFLSRKQFKSAADAANLLADSQKKQGRLGDALDLREQWGALKDSSFSEEKEKIVQAATFKFETREKVAQIASLKTEKQLANERNFWILGLSILLAGLGFWFVRFRNRKQKLLLEKQLAVERSENEALLAREQFHGLEIEAARRENELHTQQLDDFTQLLIEKNRQVEALTSQSTNNESTSQPITGSHRTDEEPMEESHLEALYHQTIFTEADWERFKVLFERVRPGFIARVKHEYPGLTSSELRLILVLKMNLQGREIADMLAVSPETIRKSKYRLRKKLGLDDERLDERVQAME